MVGSAPAGQYAFFVYQLLIPNANVTFTVTSISGDPDIFVSTSVQFPGWGNGWNWAGANIGDEQITARVGDPGYKSAGNPYYIGINAYGSANATFILTVIAEVRARTRLCDAPALAHPAAAACLRRRAPTRPTRA